MTSGPLHGIRVLTLTQAWSGTFATELIGFLGADVIQVEARRRPDNWRGGYDGPVAEGIRNPERRQRKWNTSPLYNAVNLNKRGITLDMSDPRGMDYFKRLVPLSDVVVDNFSPRVMGNWGLGFEALNELRPGIVQASLSAYGATGPYRNVPGIGGTIEPMSGMSSLMGYEGGRPMNSGTMYPDPVAGAYMAAAIVTALHHRNRTGEGQYIDLGMMEANATFIGDALAEHSANGTVRPRLGNHHLSLAPHNMYVARNGEWIALAVETEVQWAALVEFAGVPDLHRPEFASNASRKQHERELDDVLCEWVRSQHAPLLETALLDRGIPAARVSDRLEVLADQHLRDRGFLIEVEHPEAGTHTMVGVPWHFERTPVRVSRPAPMLGEHSQEVLSEFFGTTEEEYRQLVAENVSGDEPPV